MVKIYTMLSCWYCHHALVIIALCRLQMADTTRTASTTIEGNGDVGPSTFPSRRGVSTPSTQETVQGVKRKNSGGKSPGPEWQFATNVSKFIDWKCNFCGVSKSGGAPRIREHLLGGNGRVQVGRCRGRGADDAAKQLRALLSTMPSAKRRTDATVNRQLSTLTSISMEANVADNTPPQTEGDFQSHNVPTGASPEFQVGTSKARQATLVQSFRATALEEAQLAVAKAIYFTGSSLSMVNQDAWKSAWKKIGEFGSGFTPPTYNHMRNQLLEKCYLQTKENVERLIINTADQSGCTIVSDGWSNVQRRPLINIMVVCPRGECFMKAIDSSGEIKSGQFICNIISEVIEQVGQQNVVQVIMDNAKNCRAAGRLLERRFSNIYTFGCNTHSLNLVLQDWYKSADTEWFKTIIDNARRIVKFILKRQRVLDMYRQRMTTMLKLPCETRFCTNFYTVESLLRNKNAVMETFVCAPFADWETSQNERVKSKVTDVRSLLSNRQFWDSVGDSYHVMMPIMLALRQMDSASANIGKVWMAWWSVQQSLKNPEELQNSIIKPWKAPFNRAKRELLCKYVLARWVGAHSPLHSAAYLLDPEYWSMDIHGLDEEVLDDFYYVVGRFYEDPNDQASAVSELTKYKLKEGRFATEFVQKLAKEQPAWKWWLLNGGSAPTLRQMAIRILAQCASNSSSERNWSTYKYVHSTIRNRLLSARAEKLVYMYCNEKIIQHIESDAYSEAMPKWSYDIGDGETNDDTVTNDDQGYAVSLEEIEENLQSDDTLDRATRRTIQ